MAAIHRTVKISLILPGIVMAATTGCGSELQGTSDTVTTVLNREADAQENNDCNKAESISSGESQYDHLADVQDIAAIYRDIYEEAVETDPLSLETMRSMIARLGENGYAAVDSDNQIDMAGAEQVTEFCEAADAKGNAELTILVASYSGGLTRYDLKAEEGNVTIAAEYYQYVNGDLKNMNTAVFTADSWQYTEEGYLLFEGSYYSENHYALLLSDVPEQAALRVQPLDETCRELNRRYVLPVGYRGNNMFLVDWSEEDFADLDFYDLFDRFYPVIYQQPVPYVMDDDFNVGAVYRIPEELFENVIQTYIHIDRAGLRSRTTCFPEDKTYEYRPRGFYELEYPDIPYPEVVDYAENQDGTITLIVNAVYPQGSTSRSWSHEAVVRPLGDDRFQYVSNRMISPVDVHGLWWRSDRLTEEEWEETYGGG